MAVARQILWTLLAVFILDSCEVIVLLLLYRIGGGALHAIFAYSDGGRLDEAMKVFAASVATMSVASFLLIVLRYPAHWKAIIVVASGLCLLRWWVVCDFPYQDEAFHSWALTFVPVIPVALMCSGLAARRLVTRQRRTSSAQTREPDRNRT